MAALNQGNEMLNKFKCSIHHYSIDYIALLLTVISLGAKSSVLRTLTRSLSSEAMAKYKALEVTEVKPFVYHVAMNRPDKRNAFNLEMWK